MTDDAAGPTGDVVLDVRDLHTHLHTRSGVIRAVDGVSLRVRAGETLGIVGESGAGKSILAQSLVRLPPRPAGRIVAGQILLDGKDLLTVSEAQMRRIRGRRISMILQDPHQSLNPHYTVGNQLVEAVRSHDPAARGRALTDRAVALLRGVRVPAPERRMRSYPHQLSGGMKQRIVGAMATAFRPRVLIADEPTTALDLTVQAQYLDLLKGIQRESDLAMILITHDFSVVAAVCDTVAVMYAGRIVEQGPVRRIFDEPSHPYTAALLASMPRIDRKVDRLASIEGQPPSLVDLPPGCRFADRCPHVLDTCRDGYPPPVPVRPDHIASCVRIEERPWQS